MVMVSEPQAVKQQVELRYDRFAEKELAALEREAQRAGPFPLEGLRPAKRYFVERKIDAALALGRFPVGARILEVGCARGLYTFALARHGLRMTGADLSAQSIAVARHKARLLGDTATAFLTSDAETLDGIPDASFDGVVSAATLRYVPDLDRALRAIRRVLRPGGAAVLDFPNRWCPWFFWVKPVVGIERHPEDRYFTAGELRARLARAGFQDVEVQPLLFTPMGTPTVLLPAFRLADRLGERLPLIRRCAAILMCKGGCPS